MLYLGTSPSDAGVRALLDLRHIGLMCQPRSNRPRAGWIWAADNGCFNDRWDAGTWRRWLNRDHPRAGCLFAVVPDVVADAAATLDRFGEYADEVRRARYPVAYAAQDGAELAAYDPPWEHLDVLFIGGSTEWKFGEAARELAREAHARGRWVHVGRLNSRRRLRSWRASADSTDGTLLRYGARANLHRVRRWLDDDERELQLAI